MRKLGLLLSLLLVGVLTIAQSDSTATQRASQAYEAGDYALAIEYYLSSDSASRNAGTLYNLGNAYYKHGELGKAILNYERAHKILPKNPDITHNLQLARAQTLDKLESNSDDAFSTWWNDSLVNLGMNRLAWISIALAFIAALAWLIFRLNASRVMKQLGFGLGIVTTILALLVLIMSFSARNQTLNHQEAIIISQRTKVLSAPDDGSTELFILHEGSKVKLIEQRGLWSNITLPNGNVGWLPSIDISAI